MYPTFKKWLNSYRDLPIKINQYCSVVRWETKACWPFLRTREFLWHEGHTAHQTKDEALVHNQDILDLYIDIFENQMAIPIVPGVKSVAETFAGAVHTLTCEAIIPENGRGIQGATSHYLGSNFAKMYDITFQNPENLSEHLEVHQTCYAITTRSIGMLIMIHGDDKGLVLPPRVAPRQIVIIPCGIKVDMSEDDKEKVYSECKKIEQTLKMEAGLRVECDFRNHLTPGVRFAQAEIKGIPLRIEVGPKNIKEQTLTLVKRNKCTKHDISMTNFTKSVTDVLNEIHDEMLNDARAKQQEKIVKATNWDEFCEALKNKCAILAPFCGAKDCEVNIRKVTSGMFNDVDGKPLMGAKSLCIPNKQPELADGTKCVNKECSVKAEKYCLMGRCY